MSINAFPIETVQHKDLTGVNVHEPKNIENADAGDVYVADGNGSGRWEPQVDVFISPRYIQGFTVENDGSDPTNDLVILKGTCRDDTDTEDIRLTVSLIKKLDAAWAEGTNQGGRDTGAIANATWHVFVIKNVLTNTVDALFSLSATSPTMPTNYTKKRRIASIRRVGGAWQTILTVEADGGALEVYIPTVPAGNVAVGETDLVLTDMPTGRSFEAIISGIFETGDAATQHALVRPIGIAGTASSSVFTTLSFMFADAGGGDIQVPGSCNLRIKTDSVAQIHTSITGSAGNMSFALHGWKDYRRD